jgi:thiamine biosynthesis lipoprotein
MRVALGTLIVIEASSHCAETAGTAVNDAFAAVANLHALLHPWAADSELARINRNPPGTALPLTPITFDLLRLASELHTLTGGVFDPCLPHRPGRLQDVELLAGHRVIAHAPVAMDFGGFAKGYAADAAIDTLLSHGCRAGLVNAGGDLRAFGPEPCPVLLRGPDGLFDRLQLTDSALAVSDADSSRHPSEHQGYYNRASPDERPQQRYAAVVAPTAVLADALAKCLMLCPEPTAARVLRAFGATRPSLL